MVQPGNSDSAVVVQTVFAALADLSALERDASSSEYLAGFARIAKSLTNAVGYIVWLSDKHKQVFAASLVDEQCAELTNATPKIVEVGSVATSFNSMGIAIPQVETPLSFADHRIFIPVLIKDEVLAGVELGAYQPFCRTTHSTLEVLSRQASSAIANIRAREALQYLNSALQAITVADSQDSVTSTLLNAAIRLTGAPLGFVGILDTTTGELEIVRWHGDRPKSLRLRHGISGRALKRLSAIRANDVSARRDYEALWANMNAELAVPVFVSRTEIRDETNLASAPYRLGILNVQSATPGAFTEFNEECLVALASQAATILDRLEYDHKLIALHRVESELAPLVTGFADWDQIADRVLESITETLGFSYVNLSLVNVEGTRIRAERVRGTWVPESSLHEFKALSDYALDSSDIHAEVIRNRHIIVPPDDCSLFDAKIHRRFSHDQLVRVYIPMILGGVAIGVVEAGYPKRFKPHIYERDVQLLKTFVDYATTAIGQRRRGLLDLIAHEFNGAIRGIESNAHFLIRHRARLPGEKIDRKLSDILTDCGVLYHQVGHLEYYLSARARSANPEPTFVARDVILKSIHQMQDWLRELGLRASQVEFDFNHCRGLRVYVDKAQLCEVVTNLLMNAVKYRKEQQLCIQIQVAETASYFGVQVRDWGMGVRQGFEEKIFEEGFRAPEAIARVQGTGFGLAISRRIMREMGGDLVLISATQPTSFEIRIPKNAEGR